VRLAAYPGSFDPPTVAHLAIAEAVVEQVGVDRVDLVLSVDPLGKEAGDQVRVRDRVSVLEAVAASRPWLGVHTTERRLITEIAVDYDAVVVGADKWAQVLDPAWYEGSVDARDAALAGLQTVAIAPRAAPGGTAPATLGAAPVPGLLVVELDLHPSHLTVSASSVRAGRHEWMVPEAAGFDRLTGAWSDRPRYERWAAANP
jgi:phosphopantetheine adenylyltransferase